MNFYPYLTPIILDDNSFVNYDSDGIANTSFAQRQAAYRIAEMAASEDLNTFLKPTIVTGTHDAAYQIVTEYAFVHRVILTRFINTKEEVYYSVSGTANDYVSIKNKERGIVDIDYLLGSSSHYHGGVYPYQIQLVYEAGLPTGTSTGSDVLLALSTYARIILNEIIGFGNEAPGDIGVTDFKNQQYTESRVALLRTSFGSSAKANFAHGLLTKLRKLRYVGM